MIRSLHGRLLASFLAVVLVMVVTTASFAVWPILRAERTVQANQLEELATQIAIGVDAIYRRPGLRPLLGDEFLHELSEQSGTRLLIIGPNGETLADSAEETLAPNVRAALHSRLLRGEMKESKPRGTRELEASYLGRIGPYHVAVSPLPSTPGARLVVLAPALTSLFLRSLVPGLGLALLAGLATSALVTWFLARSIAEPITRLARVADAIAAGDLSQQAQGSGPDEVSRLVRSFNTMIGNLRRLIEGQRNLLQNVAHELRTPLTVIQGYAQAVYEGVLTEPSQRNEALRLIAEESERTARLLTQLLNLSRLETGQRRLEVQPVQIADLVQRILARHHLALQRRAIQLFVDVPNEIVVTGDPELLEQAIENLVVNAIQHGRDGMELTVGARLTPGTPAAVELTVRDTGPGIPPESLPHVFERFYRSTSERNETRGFGLGLALVREIVTLHSGTVDVESEPGQGTKFRLVLPGYLTG